MQPAQPFERSADRLTRAQRDALWTWRWLGWRGSTPAFKASLAIAALALAGIVAYALLAR